MNFKGVELCCPYCRGDLYHPKSHEEALACDACSRTFPILLGIPDLRVFPDPYIGAEADRTKGLRVAERLNDLDLSGLIDFYYSITSVVPKRDAQRYKRGLMLGAERARSSLTFWENSIAHQSNATNMLEIGCGTGPLLVAAAPRFQRIVGIDIAFRWLVVAKKRLAEAGLDVPLICACAEALPFPDSYFDRVVADSVLEHLSDQSLALSQVHRALKPNGYLYISTPNRFSLGPDPHVGLWGGSILPERWVAAYVIRQGGIPPKRCLLSRRKLFRLLRQAGFSSPEIMLPDISKGQRDHFGSAIQLLIQLYQAAKEIPVSRQCLQLIGPLLHAVAEKDGRVTA